MYLILLYLLLIQNLGYFIIPVLLQVTIAGVRKISYTNKQNQSSIYYLAYHRKKIEAYSGTFTNASWSPLSPYIKGELALVLTIDFLLLFLIFLLLPCTTRLCCLVSFKYLYL